jgi:hypothetical protein
MTSVAFRNFRHLTISSHRPKNCPTVPLQIPMTCITTRTMTASPYMMLHRLVALRRHRSVIGSDEVQPVSLKRTHGSCHLPEGVAKDAIPVTGQSEHKPFIRR